MPGFGHSETAWFRARAARPSCMAAPHTTRQACVPRATRGAAQPVHAARCPTMNSTMGPSSGIHTRGVIRAAGMPRRTARRNASCCCSCSCLGCMSARACVGGGGELACVSLARLLSNSRSFPVLNLRGTAAVLFAWLFPGSWCCALSSDPSCCNPAAAHNVPAADAGVGAGQGERETETETEAEVASFLSRHLCLLP